MNRPVQVMLASEKRRHARRRAAEQGLTLSEYIGRLVQHDLERWVPDTEAPAVMAMADTDAPAHHGTYIGEAVAARMKKADAPG